MNVYSYSDPTPPPARVSRWVAYALKRRHAEIHAQSRTIVRGGRDRECKMNCVCRKGAQSDAIGVSWRLWSMRNPSTAAAQAEAYWRSRGENPWSGSVEGE